MIMKADHRSKTRGRCHIRTRCGLSDHKREQEEPDGDALSSFAIEHTGRLVRGEGKVARTIAPKRPKHVLTGMFILENLDPDDLTGSTVDNGMRSFPNPSRVQSSEETVAKDLHYHAARI